MPTLQQLTHHYTGYLITPESRQKLLEMFPPVYPQVRCHHITAQFGTPKDAAAPDAPDVVRVIGYIDSGDGVEALLVSIDGTSQRPDGKLYHITHSLGDGRHAVESNKYMSDSIKIDPINISVEPRNFAKA